MVDDEWRRKAREHAGRRSKVRWPPRQLDAANGLPLAVPLLLCGRVPVSVHPVYRAREARKCTLLTDKWVPQESAGAWPARS